MGITRGKEKRSWVGGRPGRESWRLLCGKYCSNLVVRHRGVSNFGEKATLGKAGTDLGTS